MLELQNGLPVPGRYENVPPEVYRAVDSIGSSDVRQLIRSVAHYLHARANPPEETEAMIKGTLLHLIILEPPKYKTYLNNHIAVKPSDLSLATKEGKAWKAEIGIKTIISENALAEVQGMAAAIKSHPIASSALTGGMAEVSYFAIDPASYLPIKARIDYKFNYGGEGCVVDIKTIGVRSGYPSPVYPPEGFQRYMANNGLHIQAAHYNHAIHCSQAAIFAAVAAGHADVSEIEPFPAHNYVVAVENESPYGIAVYEISREAIERAMAQALRALRKFREYLDQGGAEKEAWAGYPPDILIADLPAWEYRKTIE